jgi:murein DD-endopeptidase MepM/ murein hydrolase activator NlpD
VWSAAAQSATVTLDGRDQQLMKDGEAFVGLFGIHRNLSQLGPRPLRFTLVDAVGRRVTRNDAADTFRVVAGAYPTEDLIVDEKALTLLDPVKVNQEEAFVSGIMGRVSPERHWKGPFGEPMFSPAGEVPLSSEFGTLRSINGRPTGWAHEGTDYEVDTGDSILACADGRVVYVGEQGTRGKMVIVDHGWGVMTGYFHMFQQQVQEGQMVKKGQQIGLVGSTGFVTGPHLHVDLRVRNVNVEPLEWFQRAPFSRPDLASL